MSSLRDYPWKVGYSSKDLPLITFYIPALSRAIRYDRSAGFFSSTALALAASGVAELVRRNGTMRLLVGAQLSAADVEAVKRGSTIDEIVTPQLLAALETLPPDELLRRRIEILAWMVANETLQIRVVVPRDPRTGGPLPSAEAYYHLKEGIFYDEAGDSIAFQGSINESLTAWKVNLETFSVFKSWVEGVREHWAMVRGRFDAMWQNTDVDWVAVDLPQAARDALIRYRPPHAPDYDPLAANVVPHTDLYGPDRVLFQFVRDAPRLKSSGVLTAEATSAFNLWPHQKRVLHQIAATYPRSYMICDEVGLGKTIEAGIVLRHLLISRSAQRILILAPASVTRQWQEELYEKFGLNIPRFDGARFWDYHDEEVLPIRNSANLWDRQDVYIASSQLAKRSERRDQLAQSMDWDVWFVDEAHHARRKDFLDLKQYRPNNLLTLLLDSRIRVKARFLMTATPMQVHPIEVFDLMKLIGLEGKWEDQNNYQYFYETLNSEDDTQVDWLFVFSMIADERRKHASDSVFEDDMRRQLGLVGYQRMTNLNAARLGELTPEQFGALREFVRHYTPLRRMMFRHTRDLLRRYHQQGLLSEGIATRDVRPEWIAFRPDERALYDRVTQYVSQMYNRLNGQRVGLGFIMTVYRRRLTSSFYALRSSLERRLFALQGQHVDLFTDEDTEEAVLSDDLADEAVQAGTGAAVNDEISEIQSFIRAIDQLPHKDSKVVRLEGQIRELLLRQDTILVFTQYTDTMDYLREQLATVYGTQVACYSGRGGEVLREGHWQPTTKDEIKAKFRAGTDIKILLCTEAASEGLNLQTCGVLINYDMPWNPMRVEQRIGRIDRIGQTYPTVQIINYFYEDTVEAQIYRALERRIGWFEGVIGNLQPILVSVATAIEQAAMGQRSVDDALQDINQRLDQRPQDHLNVFGEFEPEVDSAPEVPPVTLTDLEQLLTQSPYTRNRFQLDDTMPGRYLLNWSGSEHVVTFSAEVFDAHPSTTQLMTYGNQLFDQVVANVPSPEDKDWGSVQRLDGDQVEYRTSDHEVDRIAELKDVLAGEAGT